MAEPTQQEKELLTYQVRLMIGDTPTSPFYPLFQDEEIEQFLEMNNWRVRPAIRMAAIAASMQFAQFTYRERTGDIEVWNNISIQYQKALENLINEGSSAALPDGLKPYFGGIDWQVVDGYDADPNNVRSPLTFKSRMDGKTKAKNVIFLVTDGSGSTATWVDAHYWNDTEVWG